MSGAKPLARFSSLMLITRIILPTSTAMTVTQRKVQTNHDQTNHDDIARMPGFKSFSNHRSFLLGKVHEPGGEYHCDSCSSDLTHAIRIKCADPVCESGDGVDLCPTCFCAGKEFAGHKRGHPYRVIVRIIDKGVNSVLTECVLGNQFTTYLF